MGLGLATQLSSKGANVVIVARTQSKLDTALTAIKAAAANPSKQRFLAISADVTSPQENDRIIAEITAWNEGAPPDVVWANAGNAVPKLFLDADVDTLRSQMDINYWAAAYLARSTFRAWIGVPTRSNANPGKPAARHFIQTSSVVSFIGLAGYAPYSPAKSAMRSLHDTLRSELHLYNAVRAADVPEMLISTVFPGTILSPGHEIENQSKHPVTKKLEEDDPAQTGDEVAAASIAELEKGRRMIATQILGKAMRAGGMMGSARDSSFLDTAFSWVVGLVYLFVVPDMEGKVAKWAKENGMPKHGKIA